MLSRRTDLSTGEQQENKKALPLESEDYVKDLSELSSYKTNAPPKSKLYKISNKFHVVCTPSQYLLVGAIIWMLTLFSLFRFIYLLSR